MSGGLALDARGRRLVELGCPPLRLRRREGPSAIPPWPQQESTSPSGGAVVLLTPAALPERLQRHLLLALARTGVEVRCEHGPVDAAQLAGAGAVVALGTGCGRAAAAALAATDTPVVIAAGPEQLAAAGARRGLWDQLRPLLRELGPARARRDG